MYPRVAVGDHDISVEGDGEENFHVQSWVSHPQYNLATTDYDYAIITLSKPIQFSDSAMPICLPSRPLTGGEEAIVTGWGTTEYSTSKYPDVLQEASVTVLTHTQCTTNTYYAPHKVTRRMLCAAETDKDACQGDSGGPLITMEVTFLSYHHYHHYHYHSSYRERTTRSLESPPGELAVPCRTLLEFMPSKIFDILMETFSHQDVCRVLEVKNWIENNMSGSVCSKTLN